MKITISNLKEQFKTKNYSNLYFFYGEEKYILDSYVARIKNDIAEGPFKDFNYIVFDEDNSDFTSFVDFFESYPQFADRKLAILKHSPFVNLAEYQKNCESLLSSIPDYLTIIIIEETSTKLKKNILNVINKNGTSVEFAKQNPADLRAWVNLKFSKSKKRMKVCDMEYLVQICGFSLKQIATECDKLIAMTTGNEVITKDDIDKIVSVPTEYKVFELAQMYLTGKKDEAYKLLKEFRINKEAPLAIIASIYYTISTILMIKNVHDDGGNTNTCIPANKKWMVSKFGRLAQKTNKQKLRHILKECANADIGIKTGKLEQYEALDIITASAFTK